MNIRPFAIKEMNGIAGETTYVFENNCTTIFLDTTGGDINIALPDATSYDGMIWRIKKINKGGGNITVRAYEGQTIDGLEEVVLYNDVTEIKSNGSNWDIVGPLIPNENNLIKEEN